MLEKRYAGCKVNLFLKILGVREDGYHLLQSLFWPLNNPCDILSFEIKEENGLSLSCNLQDIDLKNNTLTKAYSAFIKAGAHAPSLHIHLEKNIPHGAGLGGGSSDAACLLTWLNEHARNPLTTTELERVGLSVGADVPFFLKNFPAEVCGIGEEIQEVENFLKDKCVLLVCPPIHISTPWAYGAWDEQQKNIFLTEDLTKLAHKYKHIFSYAANVVQEFSNDFESVVFKKHPELAEIKTALLTAQAEVAVMSGSGSTIVGVFANDTQAMHAAQAMQHKGYRVFNSTL